jgi:hypothetical protein
LKCKLGDQDTSNNNSTTIYQMPSTRSGKTNYKVGPEHHGRYAHANGTFASGNRKRKADDESRASTRLQTAQVEDRQKRIRVFESSPPTPTKEQLINLPRATRHSQPCCLHYGFDRGAREILYPDYFFCGNCDAYVEAMLHGSYKKLIKKDSANFICQADHSNFIFPSTKKSDRIHHTLLQRLEEVEDEDEVVASTPAAAARPLPTITPALLGYPLLDPSHRSTETPPAPVRNLQRDINSGIANRNHPNRQSTVTPLVPLRNLQHDIGSGLLVANQNQAYKTKYEETVVRLQDLEAKYNGLLDRHQTYLLKASSPIDLTVRAINLPFVDGHEFDGFDVLKDSEKKQEKKVSAFVTMIMGEGFFMDTFVVRS